jgi:hypothetical protein
VADTERFLPRAAEARRSSKYVVLADRVDMTDVVALANSGGGVIVVPGPAPPLPFDDVEIHTVTRPDGAGATAIVVGPALDAPLTVKGHGPYMRHGARSLPATEADLRAFMERRTRMLRKQWLAGIKRVLTAPSGAEIVAIERTEDEQGERSIRITTDPNAPVYRAVDFDVTHPHRQKELLAAVNERLPEEAHLNTFDILSVRRVHAIDDNPDLVHRPRFGTNQYSDALVDWIVEQYERDHGFVAKARERYQASRRR